MLSSLHQNRGGRNAAGQGQDDKIIVLAQHELAKERGGRFNLLPATPDFWAFHFFCGLSIFRVSVSGMSRLFHYRANRPGAPAEVWRFLRSEELTLGEAFVDDCRKIGVLTHTAWLYPDGSYDGLVQMRRHAEILRERGEMPMPALSECAGGIRARWPLVAASGRFSA